MAPAKFDSARFHKDQYDQNEPLHLARFQRIVEEFVPLLRANDLTYPDNQRLLDDFCTFIDDPEVWHLAQMLTPEFRLAKEDQRPNGSTSLDYVLNKLTLLPPPRNDKNVLTSEQYLLNQRHKQWVEYAITGGRGMQAATPEERIECDERISHIEKTIDLVQAQGLVHSGPDAAAGKERKNQDGLDDHHGNKEREKGKAKEHVETAPTDGVDKKRRKGKMEERVEKGLMDNVGKKGGARKRADKGPMDQYIKFDDQPV